jgi:hypothetical protein
MFRCAQHLLEITVFGVETATLCINRIFAENALESNKRGVHTICLHASGNIQVFFRALSIPNNVFQRVSHAGIEFIRFAPIAPG